MGHRRRARELALQALYSAEMTGDPAQEVLKDVAGWRNYSSEAMMYATQLTTSLLQHRDESIRFIEETAKNWELSRIALIDRIILQIGICELLYEDDVPPRVAIDEAIELAKIYSSEKSGGFINGILDTILRERKPHDDRAQENENPE